MKTADFSLKRGLLGASVAFCLALAASAPAQVTGNTQYCEIQLTGCPADYDKAELVVPLNVIALASQVQACGFEEQGSSKGGAPAVMFVIDHSSSMTASTPPPNGSNDVNGNRFRVTKALIDSIYDAYPAAEVGVVVFSGGLVFNANRDNNLARFGGQINPSTLFAGADQSYLPLMTLNQPAKTGGTDPFSSAASPAGIDVLRSLFTVTGNRGSIPGVPEMSGTDITIAFEAALEAFRSTSKDKAKQYIIFLSDGEPGINGESGANANLNCTAGQNANNPRCALLNAFTEGKNTPTTYTVFLQNSATPTTPPLIATMTDNIKVNGYSTNNENSNAWALTSDFNALLRLMMDNIITPMITKSEASAKHITISTPNHSDTAGALNGNFTFGRQLPMDTSAITSINMGIQYDVQRDSTTEAGKDTSWVVKDSLFTYSFSIRRSASPPSNWKDNEKTPLRENCRNAPTLDLQYKGTSLVGGTVKGNMNELTIVFDNTNGLFRYDSVKIQVLNADGEVSDLENFKLDRSGDKWSYTFPRVVDTLAVHGDNKLQHAGKDSIILVFRNPDVPLDTMRVSVPYVNQPVYVEIVVPDASGKIVNGNLTDKAKDQAKLDYLAREKKYDFASADNDVIFFAVLRDAWGNYLGLAEKADWGSTNSLISATGRGNGSSATIHKDNNTPLDNMYITVSVNAGDTVLTDKARIVIVGESFVSVGPNPFVPGQSDIVEKLRELDLLAKPSNPNDVGTCYSCLYDDIAKNSLDGGKKDNPKGILVVATAPRQVTQSDKAKPSADVKYANATAVIYDAVGHVVFKSKPENIIISREDPTTFGFVWDGKNQSGRTVGPGSYLMRMQTMLTNGEKFSSQRMIGVRPVR
jgi:hypothetical protein